MHKLLTFILVFLFCLQTMQCHAQNKYAVIIGINNYYQQPGVLSTHCLKGCVNDAISIRSLLINRFGFSKTNITTLLNENATQQNMTNTFTGVLNNGKAGDAILFYFCGHGIYVDNPDNESDPVKAGYNKAICMSNLYAPNYNCLVKDNTLKQIFNRFVTKKMVVTALFDCCFSGDIAMMGAPYGHNDYYVPDDTSGYGKSLYFTDLPAPPASSFDVTATLTMPDTANIPRPSETKDSKFVSISACGDYEIAKEIYDESSLPHGALTKAILSLYDNINADLPLSKVLPAIKDELNTRQLFEQTPTYHYDSNRLKGNLIGIPLNNSKLALSATCIHRMADTIIINAGSNNNLANGNILSNKSKTGNTNITLSHVYADSSVAIVKSAKGVKEGDLFTLTDPYIRSSPLLKVYVPVSNLSSAAFISVFNKKIRPLTKEKNYRDYNNWDNDIPVFNYFIADDRSADKNKPAIAKQQDPFYIFLSSPSDIAASIKKGLQSNQNVQLVNTVKEADLVLYLNYSVVSKDNKAPGFVFTYCQPVLSEINSPGNQTFSIYHIQVASLLFGKASLSKLNENITAMTKAALRGRGTRWLNEYARR